MLADDEFVIVASHQKQNNICYCVIAIKQRENCVPKLIK